MLAVLCYGDVYNLFLFHVDITAYVEVRSQFANDSRAVAQQLKKLGAIISPKFSHEVTHVVFKDGKKSTFDKAKKKGVHLVSVLWVERFVLLVKWLMLSMVAKMFSLVISYHVETNSICVSAYERFLHTV